MKSLNKKRLAYLSLFLSLLFIEIIIALFVRDRFIRPYGGDIIVTVLICAFLRVFFPEGLRLLPIYVCIFAFAVEIGQYFDFVSLMGLADNKFFAILLGSTFSFADLICYATGCIVFGLGEYSIGSIKRKNDRQ